MRWLTRGINKMVFWWVRRQLLTELHDPTTGGFIKYYDNHNTFSAAQKGVFQRLMGRPSAAELQRRATL